MDQDVWLSASAAARRLGVSRSTVWRMTPAELPFAVTRGGQRRYREADILARLGESTLDHRVTRLEERMDAHEAGHL